MIYVLADRFEGERNGEAYCWCRYRSPMPWRRASTTAGFMRTCRPTLLIKTGRRTMLDYLVQPLRDSILRARRES
jgi:hypothetical protein